MLGRYLMFMTIATGFSSTEGQTDFKLRLGSVPMYIQYYSGHGNVLMFDGAKASRIGFCFYLQH